MTQAISVTQTMSIAELQAEVAHLREELQMRDQLVQQLSQELFRLVKGSVGAVPAATGSPQQQAEMRVLREQMQGVEQQVQFYQAQMATKDAELVQLRQSVQELTDRARMLEQVVEEMPRVYHQKYQERLVPIKDRVAQIQAENRRLHAELQSVSYRLAVRSRHVSHIDLPSFPRGAAVPVTVPSLGGI